MALDFGAAFSGDWVDHGNASSVNDLDPYTIMMWIYIDTLTNFANIFSKQSGVWLMREDGAGDFFINRGRSSTWMSYTTNTAPLSAGKWLWFAHTFDTTASPVMHAYIGDLTTPGAEPGYSITDDGSGAIVTDAATNMTVFSRQGDATSSPDGKCAFFCLCNAALTYKQTEVVRGNSFIVPDSAVIFSHYGYNGTGIQTDWSGNLNNGTVAGSPTVSNHAPLGYALPARLSGPDSNIALDSGKDNPDTYLQGVKLSY